MKDPGLPVIQELQKLYYRPYALGLTSFGCSVKYQFDTLPKLFLLPAEVGGRATLDATEMRLTVGSTGKPVIVRTYPNDVSAAMKLVYDRFFDLVQSFVTGFFLTWGDKGLLGPVPRESDVLSVSNIPSGLSIRLAYPGSKVEVFADKERLVTQIVNTGDGQGIEEHPTFTPSPHGLMFTSTDTKMHQKDQVVHVRYDLDYQPVDKFFLPHNVHLIVDNIDTKFSLEKCTVEAGVVLQVSPP